MKDRRQGWKEKGKKGIMEGKLRKNTVYKEGQEKGRKGRRC